MGEADDQDRVNERDEDDALVACTAAGEERAFAVLITRHGDRIASLARHMLGPSGDVDDIVQETFLRLWSQAPVWQPGGAKLSTWLYRVASNMCIDRLRRPSDAPLDGLAEPPDPGPQPDQDYAAAKAALQIEQALQVLAPRQRMAIVLCHFEEMTNIEASQVMELTVDALESLLARGRRALRRELSEEGRWLIATLRDGGMDAARGVRNG